MNNKVQPSLVCSFNITVADVCLSCVLIESTPDKTVRNFINSIKQQYKIFIPNSYSRHKTSNISYFFIHNKIYNPYQKQKIEFIDDNYLSFSHPQFWGNVDLKSGYSVIALSPDLTAFNSVLRILYNIYLLNNKGLIFHAAGLVFHNRGYLFTGRTNVGKSTLAKRVHKTKVLNDEMVVAKLELHNKWYIYATPFGGELKPIINPRNGVKLKQIFVLQKTGKITKISSSKLLKKLLQNVIVLVNNTKYTKTVVELIHQLSSRVPGFLLGVKSSKTLLSEI